MYNAALYTEPYLRQEEGPHVKLYMLTYVRASIATNEVQLHYPLGEGYGLKGVQSSIHILS